jgi:hypothetical protein
MDRLDRGLRAVAEMNMQGQTKTSKFFTPDFGWVRSSLN